MGTTRFPKGVANVPSSSTLGNFTELDPTKNHTYFNDFDTYTAANWTITVVQAGAGNATEALADEDGGVLLITNDNADDDSVFFNKVGEGFLLDPARQSWFKARFKTSDAVQSDLVFGLQVTDTTPLSVVDGIYFLKTDGAATLDVICRKDATTGSTIASAVASVVSDTYMNLGWFYDGAGTLFYFVNNNCLGHLNVASFFPDQELTISFGIQNGEAVAKTLSVDYILASKARQR